MLSGRLGNRVYRIVDGQAFVSVMPETVDPKTPKQVAARERLDLAMRLWRELPLDAIDRWRLYGMGERRRGDLVFRGLGGGWTGLGATGQGMFVPAAP